MTEDEVQLETTDEGKLVRLPKNTLALGSRGPAIWCSLKATDDASVSNVLRWKNTKSERLSDYLNREVVAQHVLCHPVEFVDEKTGEIEHGIRTVIIDPSGNTVACVSEYARKSLDEIVTYKGLPPWNPPLTLIPRQQDTRRGKRILILELAAPPQPVAAKSKGR